MQTPGNSPSKRESKRRVECSEKERQEVNAFFSKLEVGDLCFTEIMEYGLALFGETKAGKTTLAHYLIQNPLMGASEPSQSDPTYRLNGAIKFKEAIIGQMPVSQTEIPNQITKKVRGKDQKQIDLHVLDCPGYTDSKGCYMVIANGYFHYRIFSKVKNLKFVITFDYKQFQGVFDKPKNTLIQFLMSFKNFQDIKKEVINATSFVFTKLARYGQNDETIQNNIVAKLTAFSGCGSIQNSLEYRQYIRQLIEVVIKEKRYYFFEKAQEGIAAQQNNKLLQEIHDRTKFWTRSVIQNEKEVDMSHIEMTLGERTKALAENNQRFKHDFTILVSEFKSRIEMAMLSRYNLEKYKPECSLQCITVQFLTNSILGTQKQRSFFTDYIVQFVKAFNIYKTNPFNSKKEYEEKRAAIKNNLSFPCETVDKSQIECIQKLQICRLIINMVKNDNFVLGGIVKDKRSLQSFKKLSREVLSILVQFRKIRFFKDNMREKLEYQRKLDEFNYIVYRLLEEARAFKVIFATALEKKNESNSNQFAVGSLDITQVLYDYIQSISDENYDYITMKDQDAFEKCKLTYLANHLEISSDEPDYYYTEVEKYFGNVKYSQTSFEKSASEKLVALGMVKLNSKKFKADKKEKVATYLTALKTHLNSLENGDLVGQSYDYKVELYLEATNKLASELSNVDAKENKEEVKKSLRCAIKLFDSTSNVFHAIGTHKCLVGKCEGLEMKEALVNLGDYAARHGRVELAIESYQHAYAVVESAYDSSKDGFMTLRKRERETIASKIGMLGVEKKHSPSQGYFDALLRKNLFHLIEPSLISEIESIDFGRNSK